MDDAEYFLGAAGDRQQRGPLEIEVVAGASVALAIHGRGNAAGRSVIPERADDRIDVQQPPGAGVVSKARRLDPDVGASVAGRLHRGDHTRSDGFRGKLARLVTVVRGRADKIAAVQLQVMNVPAADQVGKCLAETLAVSLSTQAEKPDGRVCTAVAGNGVRFESLFKSPFVVECPGVITTGGNPQPEVGTHTAGGIPDLCESLRKSYPVDFPYALAVGPAQINAERI